MGALLAVGFAAGYLLLAASARHQHWDSLSYSHAAETHGLVVWGNHPLGHLLMNPAFLVARQLGYDGSALAFFQFVNGLIHAAVVALFFGVLAIPLGRSVLPAFCLALTLGSTYAFWHFAGTADIYGVALLCSLLAWWAIVRLIRAPSLRTEIALALLLALAVLAHQLNAAIIFSAALVMLRMGEGWRSARRTFLFLTATGACLVLGYGLIGFIATSTTSIPELIAWARGYVGDERWGGKLGLDSVSTGWVTATNAWVGSRPAADSSRLFRGLLIAALIYAPFAGVRRIGQRGFERRTLFEAALLQCAISAMLIVWWEPRHMRFWMLLWVPYGVAVACSWADSRIPHSQKTPGPRRRNAEPARRLALFLLGVAVLGFNLRNGIIRESRPDERLETALASWRVHSEPGDTLIPTDELVPHLLFRGDRPRTVNLDALLAADPDSSDRFARLRTAIDEAHCAGHTVLVAAGAGTDVLVWRADTLPISAAELDAFFAGFERSEAFRYGDAKTGEAGVVHRLMAADDDSCQR